MEKGFNAANVYIGMSSKELKINILNQIKTIIGFDESILNPEGDIVSPWSEMDREDIKEFVASVFDTLSGIDSAPQLLNSLSPNSLIDINSNLTSLIASYEALRTIPVNEISSQHHGCLNAINNLNSILRSTGIYIQHKLTKRDVDDINTRLKEANIQLKSFDSVQFEKAILLVEELTKKKISFEEKAIKESLGTFLNRAKDHKTYNGRIFIIFPRIGQWIWLLFAALMGVIVIYFVHSFIGVLQSNGDISIGAAILRISSLAVPTYFMVFCINQYNYHKTMYEIYSFKNTSLNVMLDLMKTNDAKSDYILEKGLGVLFTEPNMKESQKYDKQLINDLISIINTQVTKN